MGAAVRGRRRGDAVLVGRVGARVVAALGGAGTPFIVTVRDGGRLVGLAPLVLARRGPFRVLTELGARRATTGTCCPSRPRARRSAALAMREVLGAQRRVARAAPGRGADGLGHRARRAGGRAAGAHGGGPTPYPGIELPATFDEYLAGLPRKRRKDLRRHMRRLDDGRLELRDVTRARRPERDHRPLAGHPRALVAAPRQAHGPRARQHPLPGLHAGPRGR